MNYGKRQEKKTLEQIKHPKSKKSKNKPKRTKWEIRQARLKKKRQVKKHKEYVLRQRKKLQHSEKPSKFNKVDNSIYNIANQHDGIINFTQLYSSLMNDYQYHQSNVNFTWNQYLYKWLSYHDNKPSYIRSYDKVTDKTIHYLKNVFYTGFLDSHDIKNISDSNSIKNATRILKPNNKTKSTAKHLPADKLFKVSHVIQNVITHDGKTIVRKYGMNKPVTVVSKIDYQNFIALNYKSNHITPEYSENHFSKYGQKLYELYRNAKPQKRTQMFIKLVAKDILNKATSDETAKIINITKKFDVENALIVDYAKYQTLLKEYHLTIKLLIYRSNINKIMGKNSRGYQDILKHGQQELRELNNLIKKH